MTEPTPTLPLEPTRVQVGWPTAAGPAPIPRAGERVAVIVAHGMGQQVHFETLESLADILRRGERRRHGAAPGVTVRKVRLGDTELPRAEILLTGATGTPRQVDLYEVYWAPLTEGQVAVSEALSFLGAAGWAGIRNGLRGGSFRRWMFQGWKRFGIALRSLGAFVLSMLVLGSLLLMNSVIAAVAAARLAGNPRWPGPALLADMTVDIGLLTVVAFPLLAVLLWGARRLRRARTDAGRPGVLPGPVRAVVWLSVWLTVLATVAMAALLAAHLWLHRVGQTEALWSFSPVQWFVEGMSRGRLPRSHGAVFAVVWGLSFVVSYFARKFLLQYVGDVAAYVSAHTVNRFNRVRQAVQRAADEVARAVYGARRADGTGLLYDHVVVVGHSLGSLIAYDMLNALILRDRMGGEELHPARRTGLFLTFGSPLDKTAYIFRRQQPDSAEIREALAAAVQPMIVDYSHRPREWVNLWSRNDWICGVLDFYDDRSQIEHQAQFVQNIEDREASTPVVAHNEYWDGAELERRLYDAVTR